MAQKILVLVIIGIVVLFLFVPAIQRLGTRLLTSSEEVTLLGFDAIPAILNPTFVSVEEAEAWMEPDEQVLGLSIGGQHRAYPIRMLSRHEIVNDVVGGVPVAVTW